MPLRLYRIDSTLVHPDDIAGIKNEDDEIFHFFQLDEGDANTIKRKNLVFVAGEGYDLKNIEKTDYMVSSYPLLFLRGLLKGLEKN